MELNNFYKNLAHCLADPLASMFNTFLEANFVLNGWLTAHVKPLLKKGVCSGCNNYQSLPCVLCKVMERLIAIDMLSIYVIIM